jgi:hypothetical protein
MTEHGCEEVRALAPEVTLGIASGEERAALLGHIATCEQCRGFVRELSTLSDELLIAAPVHEPPVGFETRVLESIGVDAKVRRSVAGRLVPLAAAALIAAALAGGGVWFGTSSERRIGEAYRQTLATANGEYFSAAKLEGSGEDEVGIVFAYQGEPSWLFVVLREGSGTYTVTAETSSGRVVALGEAAFDDEKRGWGTDVMVDVHDITTVHLVGSGENLVGVVHER